MLNDAEYAEAIVRQGLPEPKERISEWSPEREALAQVVDTLRGLTQVVITIGGGSPTAMQPARRPETALDAAKDRNKQQRYERLLARIFGQRPE